MISDLEFKKITPLIDDGIRTTFKYLGIEHEKHLILFSGPPGSGKSTVAKMLEEKLRGVRLENDAVRVIVRDLFQNKDSAWINEVVYAYLEKRMYEFLVEISKNKLWIVDASVDRRFHVVRDIAEKYGFPITLFGMNIPEPTNRMWIENRPDEKSDSKHQLLETLAARRTEQAEFQKTHKPDFVITPETKESEIIDFIIHRLGQRTEAT